MNIYAIREQVTEFHRAFDQPIETTPSVPADDVVRLRLRLIAEEFFELLDASLGARNELKEARERVKSAVDWGFIQLDMPEFADAMADLDYVVEGTRLTFGIDGPLVTAEVHRSNMAKLGPDGKPVKRPDGKIVKPDGWTPPDIVGVLQRQGWRP